MKKTEWRSLLSALPLVCITNKKGRKKKICACKKCKWSCLKPSVLLVLLNWIGSSSGSEACLRKLLLNSYFFFLVSQLLTGVELQSSALFWVMFSPLSGGSPLRAQQLVSSDCAIQEDRRRESP